MPTVTFTHSGRSVDADDGEWLYDVCDRGKSGVPFQCKAGACGTCATEILAGAANLSPQTAREVRTLAAENLDPARFRLPCLCDVNGDVTFGRPVHAEAGQTALATHEVVVESWRPLNTTVCEVRFYVEDDGFAFRPGQYVIVRVPQSGSPLRRSYSISTPPSDRHHFEICVRAVPGGFGSNYVHRLRPGARLTVEGPLGDFVLEEKSSRRILMIATGTGISPIKSMLLHLLDTRSTRQVRLLFGLRHESDLFYTDLLRGLSAHYPELHYDIVLSSPDPQRWAGRRGRVTTLLDEIVTPADAADTDVYMCGSRQMIEDCEARLRAKGFAEGAIHYENFY